MRAAANGNLGRLLVASTMLPFAVCAAALTSVEAYAQARAPLVPQPSQVTPAAGSFTIANGTGITADPTDTGAAAAARLLIAHVKTERGLALQTSPSGAIRFVRDPSINGAEAYRLTVVGSGDATGVKIAASGDAGLLYGAMTLAQLASPDHAFGQPVRIAATTIDDAPRFAWRGLMVDTARHFQSLPSIYAIVDQMASVKLNTLHLHLTDDQGWRFEVKAYPKLTEIGSVRTGPSTGEKPGTRVGGFYTQDELRKLVAYAAERSIVIVPEIDLPGHAQALVAAYPELGVIGDTPQVSNEWGVNPYLFNPAPKGIAFVKTVLDEVMAVFPGTYIHLGGDEAVKDQWERSPEVQAQMAKLGIKDENGLQSWMIDQFGEYLASKKRRLIGWDEILEGGLPPSASVMSWRGEKGAVDAANQGHDVVLTPAPILYFDSLQSDRRDEPPGRLSIQTLADVYKYEPMPAGIAPDKAHHVLGAQGNSWAEYIVTPYQMQHLIFPRAAALAEITWSGKDKRDYASFLDRVQPQIRRWRKSGLEVADSAFAVGYTLDGTRGDALRTNRAKVVLATQAGYGAIRYTLDGKTPTARSNAYTAPLSLKPGVQIRAAAFDASGQPTAEPRLFDTGREALLNRTASDMIACPKGALGLRVPLMSEAQANAPVFNINLFDTCTAYPAAPMDVAHSFTIDIARLPRHYGLAHDFKAVRQHYNVTPHGELIVLVGCTIKDTKPVVAGTFPLPDPKSAPTRFSVNGKLPAMTGDRDICLQFTSPTSDPFYAVERMQLAETR
ncbi:beta-N-acetylhexosaminidase [Sphingomonas sp. CFBP 13603]|uniref:beta-N-acetylhexosaminidase n=1 Tax=Sphingomonas sp. CFBP 13603 TaxID=2774040 RepID=UPI001FD270CE|nr:family 20 glycosylhydrolase [Sphingomonas sp. CFBP 13603]